MAYPKRSSREPFIIDGVEFTCWITGINQYCIKALGNRIYVHGNTHSHTYSAIVDDKTIGKTYRTENNACKAAVKASK